MDSLQWYAERSKNAALDFESEIAPAFQAIVSTPDYFQCTIRGNDTTF
jgi:hypothetical protein